MEDFGHQVSLELPCCPGGGGRQGHSKRVAGAHMGGGKESGEGSLAGVQGEA